MNSKSSSMARTSDQENRTPREADKPENSWRVEQGQVYSEKRQRWEENPDRYRPADD